MKIGLSYSRCVKDIFDGKVDISDILVIVAGTKFDPADDEQWTSVWRGYTQWGRAWSGPGHHVDNIREQQFREITLALYNSGKLHQPRKFGSENDYRTGKEFWLEAVLPSSELEQNPAAKKAWDQFQIVAGLVGVSISNKVW